VLIDTKMMDITKLINNKSVSINGAFDATISADKSYYIKTYLWSAIDGMTPYGGKIIVNSKL